MTYTTGAATGFQSEGGDIFRNKTQEGSGLLVTAPGIQIPWKSQNEVKLTKMRRTFHLRATLNEKPSYQLAKDYLSGRNILKPLLFF